MVGQQRFFDRGQELSFPADALLWPAEGPARIVWIIEGTVNYGLSSRSVPELSESCGPGSLLGLVDVFGRETRPRYVARAVSNVHLYAWEPRGFEIAVGIYQELARDVIQTLSSRLRRVNDYGRLRI